MHTRQGWPLSVSLLLAVLSPVGAGCRQAQLVSPAPAIPTVGPATAPAITPSPRVTELGRSVEGRPLTLYIFGDESRPVTFIFGGIHGNEPTSADVCRELVAHLTARPELWTGRCVAVLPVANPDGLARRRRTNQNLVDLNRNFPARNWKRTRRSGFFGGDAPATQPETVALIAAMDRLRPVRVVSVHSMNAPCNNYDGPGEPLARRMARFNGYPVRASIGYPTPGSFGSWAGIDRQVPTITLELPAKQPAAGSWAQNREALVAAIRADDMDVAVVPRREQPTTRVSSSEGAGVP